MISLYCERVGPGLWTEPANVTSNIGFVIAAWAIWQLRRDPSTRLALVRFFAVLTLTIAAGSALFHMLATPWARVFDETPIVLFQIAFLWCYGRLVMRWSTASVGAVIAGLLVTSVSARFLTTAVNNSLPYFPALGLTMAIGIAHAGARRRSRWTLIAGSGLFMIAVVLRSIDNGVCGSFPVGTHFLWHLTAAGVLYLFAKGLVLNSDPRVLPRSLSRM